MKIRDAQQLACVLNARIVQVKATGNWLAIAEFIFSKLAIIPAGINSLAIAANSMPRAALWNYYKSNKDSGLDKKLLQEWFLEGVFLWTKGEFHWLDLRGHITPGEAIEFSTGQVKPLTRGIPQGGLHYLIL